MKYFAYLIILALLPMYVQAQEKHDCDHHKKAEKTEAHDAKAEHAGCAHAGEDAGGSEPVEKNEEYAVYGEKMPMDIEIMPFPEVINRAPEFEDTPVYFEANITDVCQSTGCWMMVSEGHMKARVRFGDHAFFIPKDSAHKLAIVKGTVHVQEISEEQAKHYAEESGDGVNPDEINGPQREYTIMATSVKIMN
ncbi:MAG: hypothetical protein CL946_02815 [Ectothiorhodospiraceae bacterium]|nr:hypothetical protein [Ectothiorhodospiraceae bacterium]